MKKSPVAYKLHNVTNYGKFISWCIDKDYNVFRLYWDERNKDTRCYEIDHQTKRAFYSSEDYYLEHGYTICEAEFSCDRYGLYHLVEKSGL